MAVRTTEPTEIASGVWRLGTELVNWYLVKEGGRLTVVDAGAPKYRPQLDVALGRLGRSLGDVAAIVLTHAHSDHTGFAEALREETACPSTSTPTTRASPRRASRLTSAKRHSCRTSASATHGGSSFTSRARAQ